MNPKVGDILEIPTKEGLSYVFVVFDYRKTPVYGKLVKAYNKKFKERPTLGELKEMLKNKEDFYVFVVFNRKLTQELGVQRVANLGDQGYNYDNIPDMFTVFPVPGEKVVEIQNEKKHEQIDPRDSRLLEISDMAIVDLTALKDRLEENYNPINWYKSEWKRLHNEHLDLT